MNDQLDFDFYSEGVNVNIIKYEKGELIEEIEELYEDYFYTTLNIEDKIIEIMNIIFQNNLFKDISDKYKNNENNYDPKFERFLDYLEFYRKHDHPKKNIILNIYDIIQNISIDYRQRDILIDNLDYYLNDNKQMFYTLFYRLQYYLIKNMKSKKNIHNCNKYSLISDQI